MSNDMVIVSKSEIEALVSKYSDDVSLKFMNEIFKLVNKAQGVSGEPVAYLYKNDYSNDKLRDQLSFTKLDHYYVGLDREYIKGQPLYALKKVGS